MEDSKREQSRVKQNPREQENKNLRHPIVNVKSAKLQLLLYYRQKMEGPSNT